MRHHEDELGQHQVPVPVDCTGNLKPVQVIRPGGPYSGFSTKFNTAVAES